MECLAAEFRPETVGVRRIGEAVNQVPLVLIDQRMMPSPSARFVQNLSMAAPFAPVHWSAGKIT
jgi:hypothetical protein